ncbi:MAG: tetratricopeptide repeat protein [Gemmatimonadetes bacterium]|nr:tetratricopeptide repeat protein [Gemmatimonadota bacterium]
MHEEVLTQVSTLDAVRVISQASVAGLQGLPLDEVASELGVRFILEGSVRRLEDQVRITARLTDTVGGGQVWAASYQELWEDLFSVQRDIADRIARSLDAQFRPDPEVVGTHSLDSEAYDFFLRGRAYEVRSRTESDLRLAIEMYEQAVQVDPDYALAFVRLGVTFRRLYWFGFDRSDETLEAARDAVDQALSLQPGLPEAIVAQAWYDYQIERDFDEALRKLDNLDPSTEFEPELRGAIYRRQGDFDRAVESFSRAFDRNPRSPGLALDLGNSFSVLGRFAEANRSFQRAQEIGIPGWGAYWWQAWNYILWRGDVDAARAVLRAADANPSLTDWPSRDLDWFTIEMLSGNPREALRFVEQGEEWIPGQYGDTSRELLVGMALHRMGDGRSRDYFLTARDRVRSRLLDDAEDPYLHRDLALSLAWLGDRAEALEAADRATELLPRSRDALVAPDLVRTKAEVQSIVGDVEGALGTLADLMTRPNRSISPELLRLDPVWDPLRGHPRFSRFVDGG